jgi:glycosyltransferase involved in cell wall biosynthesis
MSSTPLSVVIPTYQRRASVARCVQALEHQVSSPDFQVVIVVDGSTDGTREYLETYSGPLKLRMIAQPNRGRAAACNAGIAAATGRLVLLLDDDMEPLPNWLCGHLEAHARADRRGVVGAAPIFSQAGASRTARLVQRKFERHLARLAAPGFEFGVRDFYSGNFSLAREIFAEVGGFDEAFLQYGNEDLELFVRLRQAGVRLVYAPGAVARQWYEKSFAGLARDSLAKGQTSVLLAGKHPEVREYLKLGTYTAGSPRWRALRSVLLAGSARWPGLPDRLIGIMDRLDAASLPGLQLASDLVLDYLYWLGVRHARQTGAP